MTAGTSDYNGVRDVWDKLDELETDDDVLGHPTCRVTMKTCRKTSIDVVLIHIGEVGGQFPHTMLGAARAENPDFIMIAGMMLFTRSNQVNSSKLSLTESKS